MKIFVSSNPKNLAAKLVEFERTVTVEAEYGDDVVNGTVLTLAHHGPRKDQPNPCLTKNYMVIPGVNGQIDGLWEVPPIDVIGLSHIDLDALGGTAAIMGKKPGPKNFWELAAHIDSNGPHRAADHPAWNEHKAQYYAYCAWAREKENQYWPPKDGSVEDVTERVEKAIAILVEIFKGESVAQDVQEVLMNVQPSRPSVWIEKGAAFEKKLAEDESRCLIEAGCVRVFAGDVFCSAFYRNADGTIADATISYGTKSGAISLAFEDGGKRWNAAKILQELFGSDAGGHAGIAGSPRGKRMNFAQFNAVVEKMHELIS